MQTKLLNWAKETYAVYSELVKKYDLAFYNQTPLSDIQEPVKVVVMGINPGSGGSFSAMKDNPNWGFDKLGEEYRHLIRGNFTWQKEHTRWRYWNNVMNLLSAVYPDIKKNEEKECVFTNATFFNTPKAKDVFEGLYNQTLPCTIDLIGILSPEMVISLSPNNFNRMKGALRENFQYVEVFGRRLMLGRHKDLLFVSIYHPSARYSNAYKDLVQKSLVLIQKNRFLSIEKPHPCLRPPSARNGIR
ncbi:MAG: hypothetical protein NC396_00350 [Bacteroides sp.]|nr:hypothetical protein [Bacteroides sp.]MCM1084770.1 hypothetical protein [Bacteroides sp.]